MFVCVCLCAPIIKDIGQQVSETCRLQQSRDWPQHRYICQNTHTKRWRCIAKVTSIDAVVTWLVMSCVLPEVSCYHLIIRWLQELLTFFFWTCKL